MKGFIISLIYIIVTLLGFIIPILITGYIDLNTNYPNIVYILIYLFLMITVLTRCYDGNWIWESSNKGHDRWSLKSLDDW